MLKCLYEFVEGFTFRPRFLNPILNSPDDDSYDVLWFVLRNIQYWQIHSAFRPLLQFIYKCEFSCYEYYSDKLLDVTVEPFEEVVEDPLLPTLESQHICIFDDQQ